MLRSFVRSRRVLTLGTSLFCLLVLAFTLASCGESGATTPATTAPTTAAPTLVKITEIVGSEDVYSFSPATVTIKVGDTVKWVNNSDENHLLASNTPGASTTTSIVQRDVSANNTLEIKFSTAGTYAYTSTLVQRRGGQTEGMMSSAMGAITVTN